MNDVQCRKSLALNGDVVVVVAGAAVVGAGAGAGAGVVAAVAVDVDVADVGAGAGVAAGVRDHAHAHAHGRAPGGVAVVVVACHAHAVAPVASAGSVGPCVVEWSIVVDSQEKIDHVGERSELALHLLTVSDFVSLVGDPEEGFGLLVEPGENRLKAPENDEMSQRQIDTVAQPD